ncbi:hypothetical protein KCP69_20180 [Salmonella enterica subsp. enterica]|nr:hypothetical protein KCP69_20180 [Salmonella enterica subsp. enterica]
MATWGVNYSGLKVPEAKVKLSRERGNRFTTGRILRRSAGWLLCQRRFCAVAAFKLFIGAKDKEVCCDARRWQYGDGRGRILGDRKQRIRDVCVSDLTAICVNR